MTTTSVAVRCLDYRVHNSPPPVPFLSQTNPVHAFQSYFFSPGATTPIGGCSARRKKMYSYVRTQICGRPGRRGGMGLQFDGVVIRPTYRKNISKTTAVYNLLYCIQCRTNKEDYGTCCYLWHLDFDIMLLLSMNSATVADITNETLNILIALSVN